MEKIKEFLNVKTGVILVIGLSLGWLFFGGSSDEVTAATTTKSETHEHEAGTIWTCSMHPQIKMDKPGNCPMCGMELIPMEKEGTDDEEIGENELFMSASAMKIGEVIVSKVQRITPSKDVYMQGKVMADERRITAITARFPGRIEKLNVNFTGQVVRKGEILTKIYSPDLVTAQKELFEAIKLKETSPRFYQAARNKLKLWSLTENQIDKIETSGEIQFQLDVLSPQSGTVMQRNVALGDYVKEGTPLFEIIDLSKLWVLFDAYETDLPWVKLGNKISFTTKSLPNKKFSSKITFIDPMIDPLTRVARLRLEINNSEDLLKPEMFVKGILKSKLSKNKNALIVPKTAILWTGKRAVVYVKKPNSNKMIFIYKEVELGEVGENYYVITSGLEEGEEVASNGVFKIDAAAQLLGKQSMMNPKAAKMKLGHGGMDMGGGKKKGKMKMGKGEKMEQREAVSPKFQKQLLAVYQNYLNLKDGLVATDNSTAQQKATQLLKSLKDLDMTLLKGDNHILLMTHLKVLKSSAKTIASASEIAAQREAFSLLSNSIYESVVAFGVAGNEKIYYQFCPMANDNKGAYWLSSFKEIKNPYLGAKMMTCGDVKATIN